MGDFHNIFKNLRMQNHYTGDRWQICSAFPGSAVSMYETGNRRTRSRDT